MRLGGLSTNSKLHMGGSTEIRRACQQKIQSKASCLDKQYGWNRVILAYDNDINCTARVILPDSCNPRYWSVGLISTVQGAAYALGKPTGHIITVTT